MSTWITRLDAPGDGPRVALKDVFDVAGVVTTNGSRAYAALAEPAAADAACLAGSRSAGARIVGKANLHELGFGTTGLNPWFGNPVNPRYPDLVPGGSSSGPAVAVASGEVDVGFGTDTGGSVRIPAACCGIVGLKTTAGRVPTGGVFPLAPDMDSVGPLGADVAGAVLGMQLLEPGFRPAERPSGLRIGRLRVGADPVIDAALDAAIGALGFDAVEIDATPWADANVAARVQLLAGVHDQLGWLARERADGLGADTLRRFASAAAITPDERRAAAAGKVRWLAELRDLFGSVDVLALPTLSEQPPPLADATRIYVVTEARAVNLAGLPALAMPVPTEARVPASLQLIAPWGGEELLVALAALLESAVA